MAAPRTGAARRSDGREPHRGGSSAWAATTGSANMVASRVALSPTGVCTAKAATTPSAESAAPARTTGRDTASATTSEVTVACTASARLMFIQPPSPNRTAITTSGTAAPPTSRMPDRHRPAIASATPETAAASAPVSRAPSTAITAGATTLYPYWTVPPYQRRSTGLRPYSRTKSARATCADRSVPSGGASRNAIASAAATRPAAATGLCRIENPLDRLPGPPRRTQIVVEVLARIRAGRAAQHPGHGREVRSVARELVRGAAAHERQRVAGARCRDPPRRQRRGVRLADQVGVRGGTKGV